MNKDILEKFKKQTGDRYSDIAEVFGVSRQHVDYTIHSDTLTNNACTAFYLTTMIETKIWLLTQQITALEKLKCEVNSSVIVDRKRVSK